MAGQSTLSALCRDEEQSVTVSRSANSMSLRAWKLGRSLRPDSIKRNTSSFKLSTGATAHTDTEAILGKRASSPWPHPPAY